MFFSNVFTRSRHSPNPRAQRHHRRQAPDTSGLSVWERTRHFFARKQLPQLLGTSLTTLKLQGFIPEDFIEFEIPWDKMPYSIDDCAAFGFTFDHMLAMNFQPHHFKQFEWRHYRQMRVDADAMLKTCLSVHDLIALKFTPQQLHHLKWSWAKLKGIGATPENINMSASDQQLYFKQTTQQVQRSIGAFKF